MVAAITNPPEQIETRLSPRPFLGESTRRGTIPLGDELNPEALLGVGKLREYGQGTVNSRMQEVRRAREP